MIIGAGIFPVGLFWFAWTSSPHISPWPQIVAGIPIGAGIFLIFLHVIAYLVDVYLVNANSAISANTIVRSLAGGGFPLFALPMYHNLGVSYLSLSNESLRKLTEAQGGMGDQFTGFSGDRLLPCPNPSLHLRPKDPQDEQICANVICVQKLRKGKEKAIDYRIDFWRYPHL